MSRPNQTTQPFNPGDAVILPATVLRMRDGNVEAQLPDGQLVRTPAENVMLKDSETKAVSAAPENKAVRPGENKAAKKGQK